MKEKAGLTLPEKAQIIIDNSHLYTKEEVFKFMMDWKKQRHKELLDNILEIHNSKI